MGIGTSIVLIAIGAILYYAVNVDVSGIEIQTVGLILLVIGVLGLVLSLIYEFMYSRPRRADPYDETVVREREYAPPPRDRYRR